MESKNWYESIGVWGGIVAVIVSVAIFLKVIWMATSVAELIKNIDSLLLALSGIAGSAMAIYGRVKATKEIK